MLRDNLPYFDIEKTYRHFKERANKLNKLMQTNIEVNKKGEKRSVEFMLEYYDIINKIQKIKEQIESKYKCSVVFSERRFTFLFVIYFNEINFKYFFELSFEQIKYYNEDSFVKIQQDLAHCLVNSMVKER